MVQPPHVRIERLTPPVLIAHGGAGNVGPEQAASRTDFIVEIVRAEREALAGDLRDAALRVIRAMEIDERFNAGRGSKLQRDGRVRVSAAVMDGRRMRISAIYNALDCLHVTDLAMHILEHRDRNLDGTGAAALMRELGVQPETLETPTRIAEHQRKLEGATGTIGAVGAGAPGPEQPVWALTSTGGRGHEAPGRVSDSPTPAGNYACPQIAISATGVGETILDLNLCGRLATRVADGMPFSDALDRCMQECHDHGAPVGLIAVLPDGTVGWGRTTPAMPVGAIDATGRELRDF